MARRVRTTRRAPGPRRKWVWARGLDLIITLSPGQVTRFDMLEAFTAEYDANLIGATIMRVRGRMSISDGVGAVAGDQMISAAIVQDVRPLDQFTDGPYNSPHDDWFMWEPFCVGAVPSNGAITSARLIDVQSARKIDELGSQPQMYIAASPSNTGSIVVSAYLSSGLKLH